MFHFFMSVAGHRTLFTKLNVRQYGHQGLEMAMSYALARAHASDVCFLIPSEVVSRAMFEIRPAGIRVRRGVLMTSMGRAVFWARDRREEWGAYLAQLDVAARYELMGRFDLYVRDESFSKDVRGVAREAQRRVKAPLAAVRKEPTLPLYYQRRLLREPVPVTLSADAERRARDLAALCGVDPDSPLVTLHVRESGWKAGREVQDTKPGARDDSTRNARIEQYFDAIDALVARGYTVVRVGDPSMRPVSRAGLVDLATHPKRDNLLELYCMMRSAFFLSGEAGPVGVSYLTNTPLLTVNATDPISSYPIRREGRFITKRVIDPHAGRYLTLEEIAGEAHLAELRNVTRFRYEENTPEEIRLAAMEMVDVVTVGETPSAAQLAFQAHAAHAGDELRSRHNYIRKWGSDQGFIGDGLISRFYAERGA
jgi:putative glycosyltransferase (TIGR04372 family)